MRPIWPGLPNRAGAVNASTAYEKSIDRCFPQHSF
jgi:hypothetical protein